MWKALIVTAVLTLGTASPIQEANASDAAVFIGVREKPVEKPTPREYAKRASRSSADYSCLYRLWMRESHWNHKADNPHSSAYGIAQMLHEKSRNPYVQIDHGLRYIAERYGSACAAWKHWQRNGWY